MAALPDGLRVFKERVEAACARVGRDPRGLRLLAVSKGQSPERIEAFLESGLAFWALGESYLDELVAKRAAFSNRRAGPAWHFIGKLQSRKLPEILAKADVLHSVSRAKELALVARTPKDFFVQVNVSDEDSKNGCLPSELGALFAELERLGLRKRCLGLMGLPSPLDEAGESRVRGEMLRLRELRDRHLPGGLLNMGTSGDFEIAIEEGADVVRVGSLLFGERAAR